MADSATTVNTNPGADGSNKKGGRAAVHPFFWALLVLAVLSGIGAALAPSAKVPSYALRSVWLYRLEVGGAIFLGLYMVALLIGLAWDGKGIRQVQLPGGVGITVDQNLEGAADGLATYKTKTDERIAKLESSIDLLTQTEANN